ncbi:toxic anion resistance protein [Streptomyces sp. NBRC 110611]|uniref:VWA domain-containing protein n=1 Tax=Streptomyces sp. NBRC 110611 TaxID=1621259 RepID=UPI0008562320|nr:VWA domain-containing protein [Streptomyces sp. NBRC 110611]GAU66569.1 toxic anion resistance protein [Streptomyces sp. NBRC 110611]
MGIRSLLRNAFGRSKATREGTGAAPSGADKPESATIPEAREEPTPAPSSTSAASSASASSSSAAVPASAPAAEVPAARTAPSDGPDADPYSTTASTPAPTTAPTTAPATATLPAQGSPVDRGEPPVREPDAERPTGTVTAEVKTEVKADSHPTSDDTVADLVSQAFDSPSPAPDETVEPAAAPAKAQPDTDLNPETESQAEPRTETEPRVEPRTETEPQAEPRTETELAATAPALVSLYKSARVTLDKHGLATQRAAVYLILDRSGSMRNYYKDGTVQHLAEQALGLAVNFDDDAIVPVIFFSTDVDGSADLDLTNYQGRIDELHSGLGHMGRTNYHWAINAVVEHYKNSGSTAPAFVIFQTDGAPTSKPAAERALCEAAELPIFWQFIGFGDPEGKGFDFLRKLDDLAVPEKRVVDNAGFFHAGRDPRALSHDELYQQLMVEFPEWLTEARTAGVLKDN